MSDPIKPETGLETVTFNEVQLLLAEKRTSLSTMRTGIAVFAFPLSVLFQGFLRADVARQLELEPSLVLLQASPRLEGKDLEV